MSLTWHIIKKDWRRFWPLFALWWAVLALRAAHPAMMFRFVGMDQSNQYLDSDFVADRLRIFLLAADVALTLLIPYFVVRADSPIDDHAHWRVLPAGRARMLAAKAGLLGFVAVLVPALIGVAAKVAYHFPPDQWLDGLGLQLFSLTAWVTAPAVLCVLFRRPLVAAGVLCACAMAAVFIEVRVIAPQDVFLHIGEYAVTLYGAGVRILLVLATGLAACAYMYLHGRRVLGGLVVVAGLMIAVIAGWLVQGPQLATETEHYIGGWLVKGPLPAPEPEERVNVPTGSVKELGMDKNQLWLKAQQASGFALDLLPYIHIDPNERFITSIKPNEAAVFDFMAWSLEWPDGEKITGGGSGYSDGLQVSNVASALNTAGLGQVFYSEFFYPDIIRPYILLKRADAARLETVPAKWQSDLHFSAASLVRVADLPLTPGASCLVDGEYTRIVSRRNPPGPNQPGDPFITLRIVQQKLREATWPYTRPSSNQPLGLDTGKGWYLLWNPKKGECITNVTRDWDDFYSPTTTFTLDEGNGLSLDVNVSDIIFDLQSVFYLQDKTAPSRARVPVSPQKFDSAAAGAWLADARLVIVCPNLTHHYVMSATIDPFVAPDKLPPEEP
jgi:hypothetical protein